MEDINWFYVQTRNTGSNNATFFLIVKIKSKNCHTIAKFKKIGFIIFWTFLNFRFSGIQNKSGTRYDTVFAEIRQVLIDVTGFNKLKQVFKKFCKDHNRIGLSSVTSLSNNFINWRTLVLQKNLFQKKCLLKNQNC